jgi:hypothetical protein
LTLKIILAKKIENKTYDSSVMTPFSILLLAFIFCVGIVNLKAKYLLVEVDQDQVAETKIGN